MALRGLVAGMALQAQLQAQLQQQWYPPDSKLLHAVRCCRPVVAMAQFADAVRHSLGSMAGDGEQLGVAALPLPLPLPQALLPLPPAAGGQHSSQRTSSRRRRRQRTRKGRG